MMLLFAGGREGKEESALRSFPDTKEGKEWRRYFCNTNFEPILLKRENSKDGRTAATFGPHSFDTNLLLLVSSIVVVVVVVVIIIIIIIIITT